MTPPDRLRALLAEPGFVVMPAVWDGLSARLASAAGFKTAFLSGSCVAASRLGGPDLDLISFAEMFDTFNSPTPSPSRWRRSRGLRLSGLRRPRDHVQHAMPGNRRVEARHRRLAIPNSRPQRGIKLRDVVR
jgi:hypothetical protein